MELQEILARAKSVHTSSFATEKEREQFRVDTYNAEEGNRNEEDGYDCRLCKNKGDTAELREYPAGIYTRALVVCKCEEIRRSILRMRQSGLKDIIKDYTFDKFIAEEPWQQTIKQAAMDYAKEAKGWFFLGGQSGAGKTHLCTAICREFLLAGKRVSYMLWRDEIVKIKSLATDGGELGALLERYKTADILYIDDLFKTGKGADTAAQRPTVADINYAFEIINYRYNNPSLLTIVSSELTEDELLDIDEAIGGRIFERAKSISIAKNRDRNYRIRKAVTL